MKHRGRRSRLLLSTALVLAACPVAAQTVPASGQLPTGMRVVAGQASAASQGATLQVNQQSGRAALDWSSFNIGSRAAVRFNTPGAQATTLNRVGGPDASVIAGQLTSNGQLVLINQSGVVFMPGAVVDAQSVVVSAAGITEQGMRAGVANGHFVLDQAARAGAQVVNAGRISVHRAGLAALVAPQVANHGTISAPFGTVSLSGVTSHVVDLYGDGLLSIDVSAQTIQGSGGQAALVTNDGLIQAQGGLVTLSTAAVDGVVTNLVTAGGRISADSAGYRGGTVLIDAEGGSAQVTGTITARGYGPATSVGGQIGVMASGQVNIAAGARLDASGRTGGGTVAIGTTLARARGGVGTPAPAAGGVTIAAGASIAADALDFGTGGQVTVLSTDSTVMAGNLSARGGALSGAGGNVEVSGFQNYSLTGNVDVGAAHGDAGALTIDPGNITIDTTGTAGFNPPGTLDVPSGSPDAVIAPSILQGFNGDIHLIADQNILVNATFTLSAGHDLTMQAINGSILVNDAFANNGAITLVAGSSIAVGAAISASGILTLQAGAGGITQAAAGSLTSTGSGVALFSAGPITLGANLTAAASVDLAQATSVTQTGGAISTPALFSSSQITGPVTLGQPGNNIGSLGSFAVGPGNFTLVDAAPTLTVAGEVFADTVSVVSPRIVFAPGGVGTISGATVELSPPGGGTVTLGSDPGTGFAVTDAMLNAISANLLRIGGVNGNIPASTVTVAAPFGNTALPTLELDSTAGITVNAALVANTLLLGGGGISQSLTGAATVSANVLGTSGFALGGALDLPRADNAIAALGPINTTGSSVTVATSGALQVSGAVATAGGSLTLATGGGDITLASTVTVGALSVATAGGGNVIQQPAATLVATSIGGSSGGSITLVDSNPGTTTVGNINANVLSLTTAGPLTTGGAIVAGSVTLAANGLLDIASAVTGSVIDLSAGSLTEDPLAGSLNALSTEGTLGVLTSTGGIAGDATLAGVNTLTGVQNFRVGGTLFLFNARSLAIGASVGGGTVSAFQVTNGGSIEIDQPIVFPAAGGTLELRADALVVQQGASADVSTGTATGTLDLIAVAPNSSIGVVVGGGALVSNALTLQDSTLAPLKAATLQIGGIGTAAPIATGIDVVNVNQPGVLQLDTSGPVTETLETNGALTAGALTGLAGSIVLTSPANNIGSLGSITAGGTLALATANPVLNGIVTAADISLQVDGIGYASGSLVATGVAPAGGTIEIAPRDVAVLNLGTATDVAFVDAGVLANLNAVLLRLGEADLRTSATGLAVNAPVTVNSQVAVVDLETANGGPVTTTQAGAIALSGTLTGNTGAVTLTGGNSVPALGPYTVDGGEFQLNDLAPLTIAGNVAALSGSIPFNIDLKTTGALTLAQGSLIAPLGVVDLTADGASQASGIIEAATLDSSGTPGGSFLLSGANLVQSLGFWNSPAGLLELFDVSGAGGPAALTVTGPVAATALELQANAIGLAGNINTLGGVLDLSALAGGVTQTAGTILAGLLAGQAQGGAVLLGDAGNGITALGAFTVPAGSFTLNDAVALQVSGAVQAVSIQLLDPATIGINQGGGLIAPGSSVDLVAPSASETGNGFIQAATLLSSGTPTGAFALGGPNLVATLGNFQAAPGGSLALADAIPLTVAGPVSATAVTLSATQIVLAGTVAASTVDLSASSAGVAETTGSIVADTLVSSGGIVGGAVLDSAGNSVVDLGTIPVASGDFSYFQPGALAVAGAVTAANITLQTGGALQIAGALAAGATVNLLVPSAAEGGVGVIGAATLLLGNTPAGAFVLDGPNHITSLGPFQMASGGVLQLADMVPLTVAGVAGASEVVLSAPQIIIAEPLAATTVDLSTSQSGVTETPTGSITASLLTSTGGVAGGATLDNPANAVGTLGNLLAGNSDISFAQPGSLAVAGTVAGADLAIRISGGALQIAGLLVAGGTVDLGAIGASETGTGAILAGVLESTQGATGTFALTGPNQVAALGVFGIPLGTLSLSDAVPLTVTGPVSAAGISLYAQSLTLNGNIESPAADLATFAGPLVQTGGALQLGTLASQAGVDGSVSLLQPNQIGALGNFSARGPMTLANAADLTVAGSVLAPAGLRLLVSGALTEAGQGSIATANLSGQAASAQLASTANAIAALDFATTAGALSLTDSQSLAIAALSGPGAFLTVSGDLVLAGAVSEPGAPLVASVTGNVLQTGGTLSAGLLAGTAAAMSLPGANAVAALGNITAPGGFVLFNASGLAIPGMVQAGFVDLSIASGGITEPGGALVTNALFSSRGIGGNAVLTGANQVAVLGPISDSGSFQFRDTQALVVGNVGAAVLDLSTSAGGVSENGPVTANRLASSFGIVGGARFDNPANRIQALGAMPVSGGDLLLTTQGALQIAGPVTAPNAALTASGPIGQFGDIVVPGTLSVTSGSDYQRVGGALVAGTLTGRAVSFADFGNGAAVQRLGAFTVNDGGDGVPGAAAFSDFSLFDATPLTLAGPLAADYIRISATGSLTWSGNLTTFGLSRFQQVFSTPSDPGTWLQVLPGANGTAQLVQTGVVNVFTQDGAVSTIRLQLPPAGGSISLGGLQAPTTDLLLFIGAGRVTGQINVGDLLVSGALGGVSLFGTVHGLVGSAAARASEIAPFVNANYRLNSCPIRSVNCILLPVEAVPAENPLADLAIGQARDELDDTDVLLPDVAEQDY